MTRAMIFPYHPDIEYLEELEGELENFAITGVYSFVEDKTVVDEVNRRLGCDLDEAAMLDACDTVILLDNYRGCLTDKYFDVIEKAKKAGKNE